ncbi:BRI3-binding protein [Tachyglossus aculeatus]|uniref:BRI3-binding protein n=1 Tax=Tachyglossus aculeatus TaxID=9261 RepID=UPI0018F74316|nr:BRI3-binding protein [Tachyglossus aculeatus]
MAASTPAALTGLTSGFCSRERSWGPAALPASALARGPGARRVGALRPPSGRASGWWAVGFAGSPAARREAPGAGARVRAPGVRGLLLLLLLPPAPPAPPASRPGWPCGRGCSRSPGAEAARWRPADRPDGGLRRGDGSALYQRLAGLCGEHNLRAMHKFFSRLTERFVYGVDVLVDTLWRIWTDLLDVLGIDASNVAHYFSPAAVANNPTRALLLVGAVLLAYWFLSLFLGFFFYLLHVLFGRLFWIVRVGLFALSCVYILQKYEGEPEHAVLPLCFVVAVYFMTGPVGFYWRRSNNHSLEEKIDHLDSQIRLLNIRLTRVLESIDRANDK